MNKKIGINLCLCAILLTGCGIGVEQTVVTPTFITATLRSTDMPAPTENQASPIPQVSSALPVQQPIEGVTTTQLNLRSEPSTAGESLGMVAAFSTVQIIGRESFDRWYQIADASSPTGNGWIIASYVQVQGAGEIPLVDRGTGGLIIQGLNIRNGPGRSYDSLGTLVANDIVQLTGRDASGDWLQINFKGSTGWAAAEFVQVENAEALPVVAQQEQEAVATQTPPANGAASPAFEDQDSLTAPIASVRLGSSGAGGLQSAGWVFTPGDPSDWVQFTPFATQVAINVQCPADQLVLNLYRNGLPSVEALLKCNETKIFNTEPGQAYTLELQASAATSQPLSYSVVINAIH